MRKRISIILSLDVSTCPNCYFEYVLHVLEPLDERGWGWRNRQRTAIEISLGWYCPRCGYKFTVEEE